MTTDIGKRLGLIAFAAVLLAGCGASNPTKQAVSAEAMANPVAVSQATQYRKDLVVPMAVRNECQIQGQLPEFIETFASRSGIAVVRGGQAVNKKGRFLEMEIVNVVGTAGGAWSGAKSLTVEGKLHDNGKVIGTFTATRHSGGGAFGGYKGTCSILGRCVKAIGQDVAQWLENPTMNARLGDR